jgi:hypothetical protein
MDGRNDPDQIKRKKLVLGPGKDLSEHKQEEFLTPAAKSPPSRFRKRRSNAGFVRAFLPLLLSHHPGCEQFRDDTFRLGPLRFCTGCFIAYPVAFALLALGLRWHFPGFPWWFFLSSGIALGLVQLLSLVGLTGRRWVKIVSKVCLGFGLAWCPLGIVGMPVERDVRLALLVGAFAGIAILGMARFFVIMRACKRCSWKADHDNCPGIGPILYD